MRNVNPEKTQKFTSEAPEHEEIRKENIGRDDLHNDSEYIYLKTCNRRLSKTIAGTIRFLQKTIIEVN